MSPPVAAALAVLAGGMVAVMYASHRSGHWWGDDWALYLRQAQGLLDGEPGAVFDDNRFSVETSRGAPFSPPLYPWGFPLLLAPFVAVVGTDVDRLTIVPVLCATVFACCWFALARRRLGTLTALVGVVGVTLTPLLLGWTELIQSEWPFLAVTGVVLVALDQAASSGALADASARLAPLVLLGLGAAASFSVRREGLAMTAAIAAAQLAALAADPERRWRRDETQRRAIAGRLLLPHLTALAAVLLLQWLLPSTLVPSYSGTSLANVWRFRSAHIEHLTEVSGLKRPWDADTVVLGSTAAGVAVTVVYLGAALAGIALALTRNRTRDAHLVAYAAVAFAIGGSFRSALNRYVCTVAPILLLLGLVAVAAVVRRTGRPRLAVAVTTLVVGAIAAGNLANAHVRVDRASAFADAGSTEWGATHPDAQAMFDAVRALTDQGDVVAAPKARAITLETDRRAVQVDRHRPMPTDIDVAIVVTERGQDVFDTLIATPGEYELVWQNRRFAIFRPT